MRHTSKIRHKILTAATTVLIVATATIAATEYTNPGVTDEHKLPGQVVIAGGAIPLHDQDVGIHNTVRTAAAVIAVTFNQLLTGTDPAGGSVEEATAAIIETLGQNVGPHPQLDPNKIQQGLQLLLTDPGTIVPPGGAVDTTTLPRHIAGDPARAEQAAAALELLAIFTTGDSALNMHAAVQAAANVAGNPLGLTPFTIDDVALNAITGTPLTELEDAIAATRTAIQPVSPPIHGGRPYEVEDLIALAGIPAPTRITNPIPADKATRFRLSIIAEASAHPTQARALTEAIEGRYSPPTHPTLASPTTDDIERVLAEMALNHIALLQNPPTTLGEAIAVTGPIPVLAGATIHDPTGGQADALIPEDADPATIAQLQAIPLALLPAAQPRPPRLTEVRAARLDPLVGPGSDLPWLPYTIDPNTNRPFPTPAMARVAAARNLTIDQVAALRPITPAMAIAKIGSNTQGWRTALASTPAQTIAAILTAAQRELESLDASADPQAAVRAAAIRNALPSAH